jgi:hypothetical protein
MRDIAAKKLSDSDLELILNLARTETEKLERLKIALEAGDDVAALRIARTLIGVEEALKGLPAA